MASIEQLEAEVREAESRLADAREEVRHAQQDRLEARAQVALAADRSDFYADQPEDTGTRDYVLPLGRDFGKWSPFDVENASLGKNWLAGALALVCQREDEARTFPSRIIFSGSESKPSAADRIGCAFTARHDQTGARLGYYRVVGIVVYGPQGDVLRVEGNVPDRKMSQNTKGWKAMQQGAYRIS